MTAATRQSIVFAAWAAALAAPAAAQVRVAVGPARPPGLRPGPTADGGGPSGLHVAGSRTVSFPHSFNDGAGYQWQINNYGAVGSGSSRAYSYGVRLRMNGYVYFNTPGRLNKAGDELEIGPTNRSGLNVSRRVKVYKDRGLARWLDIFENPSPNPVTAQVQVKTSIYYGIASLATNSGSATFGAEDFAFTTRSSAPANMNAPVLLHVVCGPKAKLRPTLSKSSSYLYVNFNLTVPAGSTAVLCYFESQARSEADHRKLLKGFRPYRLLKDLPPSVRKLIANFEVPTGYFDVTLERSDTSDAVLLVGGDPVFGEVTNRAFEVHTVFGKLNVPADKTLGMVADARQPGRVRAVLSDGQVVCGRVPGDKLHLTVPSGGKLEIPFDRIRQWSYRVSKSRPEEVRFAGPYVTLRTGDRLAFDPASVELSLRTRHGRVPLAADGLWEVRLDNPGHGVHRAMFRNGSSLAGLLEPAEFAAALRLGRELRVSRDLVRGLQFASEPAPDGSLTRVVLTNGDELRGAMADAALSLRTGYGAVEVSPSSIRSIRFGGLGRQRALLTLWDGTTLRGRLGQNEIRFRMRPGPELPLAVGQCLQVVRSQALPPQRVRARVARLVADLAADAYRTRQAATDKLLKLGKGVVPILREHLDKATDAEVRTRIQDIIERLTGRSPRPPAPPAPVGAARDRIFLP